MPSSASVSARRLVGTLSASPAEVSLGVNENGAAVLNSVVRLRHKMFMSLNWFINFKASILKKINLFKSFPDYA
jgi:hypothetical protein